MHIYRTTAKPSNIINIIRGDSDSSSSVIVGSNLRRALQTTCVALYPRLEKKNEKIQSLTFHRKVHPAR